MSRRVAEFFFRTSWYFIYQKLCRGQRSQFVINFQIHLKSNRWFYLKLSPKTKLNPKNQTWSQYPQAVLIGQTDIQYRVNCMINTTLRNTISGNHFCSVEHIYWNRSTVSQCEPLYLLPEWLLRCKCKQDINKVNIQKKGSIGFVVPRI